MNVHNVFFVVFVGFAGVWVINRALSAAGLDAYQA